jgi:hypothetical protein
MKVLVRSTRLVWSTAALLGVLPALAHHSQLADRTAHSQVAWKQ